MAGPSPTPPDPDRRALSLAEHVVLAVVAESPTHGFAVARVAGPDGEVGQVCRIPRPVVYRSLDRLLDQGLVQVVDVQDSRQGPRRTRYRVTPAGRRAVEGWLGGPVAHVRDIRVEFLVKLVLLRRAGRDYGPLVAAQREILAPIVAGLEQQAAAGDADQMMVAWRYETARAVVRFLDTLTVRPGR